MQLFAGDQLMTGKGGKASFSLGQGRLFHLMEDAQLIIDELSGADAASRMTIQYGGSVKPENIRDLMKMENIDGALVGGASLKAETFLPIVQFDR